MMAVRHWQRSAKNGPWKIDGERFIKRCFDCSQSGACEPQKLSPWPATEIADGCPLPDGVKEGDAYGSRAAPATPLSGV